MTQPQRLVRIVQPYVPGYRVPFFEDLARELLADNIYIEVVAGIPRGAQAERGDASRPSWLVPHTPHDLRVFNKSVQVSRPDTLTHNADGLILGLVGSSPDCYTAALLRRTNRFRLGLWGHVQNYVNDPHPIDVALEKWLMRRSDMVFAYTSSGAKFATEQGIPPRKITTVMNSISTTPLIAADKHFTQDDVKAFQQSHGARPGKLFTFLGGLDQSKRIEFLAESLDVLWAQDPTIRIAILGSGSEKYLMSRAANRGQVILHGFAGDGLTALSLRSSVALVSPGRIGLVAVTALALARPILTTQWPYHSVEQEYLKEGESQFTSADSPQAFASLIRSHANKSADSLPTAGSWPYPTLEGMVTNFARGIREMLAA